MLRDIVESIVTIVRTFARFILALIVWWYLND